MKRVIKINCMGPPIARGRYGTVLSGTFGLKKVAIKVVDYTPDFEPMVQRELALGIKMNHPNVLSVLAGGTLDSRSQAHVNMIRDCVSEGARNGDVPRDYARPSFAFVMQLMEETLWDHIYSGVATSIKEVQSLTVQLLRGLHYIHEAGVLHRDLKPSNILLCNAKSVLKIADLGIACSRGQDGTVPFSYGYFTAWYRPPELLVPCESYDVNADVWSAGCVIGELVARKPLFPYDDEKKLLKAIMTALPSDLDIVITSINVAVLKGANADALDLISALLKVSPVARMGTADALLHPFCIQQRGCSVL